MKITVAHSPDSDDAFMFYGLASGAVKVDGIEVDQVLSDIETLNHAAFEGKYEVTAVSFNAYTHLVDKYALLPHGASMGDKYGPILVARRPIVAVENGGSLRGLKIGVPGTLTSAYLTLQMFDPDFTSEVMPFDEIQQAVADVSTRACSFTKASSRTPPRACARSWTWASGGSKRRAACRCRLAATSSVAISDPS
jgi:1,4-dihydroxy-6-naphthoate synthase